MVVDDDGVDPTLARSLATRVAAAMRQLGLPHDAEFSIVLTGDERLHDLNRRYRGIDAPTDVLSFPTAEAVSDPGDPPYLGDVLISVAQALAQATAAGQALADELTLLAVHGLLHLIGHDDTTDEGAGAMEALERRLGVRPDGATSGDTPGVDRPDDPHMM